MKILLLVVLLTVGLTLSPATASKRIYIRHRRSAVEREDSPGKESKESTIVIASDSKSDSSAVADLPDDLKPRIKESEKDCKDFFEMDYNPQRDMFMFNGQIPHMFHPFGPNMNTNSTSGQGVKNVHELFQQMMQQASQMFNHFPMPGAADGPMIGEKYPDNYNGTQEEIVDIDGEKFVKKTKIINKVMDGLHVHLVSTSYVKKDDASKPDVNDDEKRDGEKRTDTEEKKMAEDEKDIPIPKNVEETTRKPNDLTDGTVVPY